VRFLPKRYFDRLGNLSHYLNRPKVGQVSYLSGRRMKNAPVPFETLIAATVAIALCILSPTRTAAQTGASASSTAAIPVVAATPTAELPVTAASSTSDIPQDVASSTETIPEIVATPTKAIIPIAVEFFDKKELPEKLFVQVWQLFGSRKIPAPGAAVQLMIGSDAHFEANADMQGVGEIPLTLLKGKAENSGGAEKIEITANAAYNGASATYTFGIAATDVMARLKGVARQKHEEGKNFAKSGDCAAAIDRFRETLNLFPTFANAQFNIALCYEKMGMSLAAIRDYLLYLNLDIPLADAFKAKVHIITLEKSLDASFAVPAEAQKMFADAIQEVSMNEYEKALSNFDLIEKRYPWWIEPYYSAGIVAEYLGYNKDFKYFSWATLNSQVFLRAVNKGDPRLFEVVQKLDDIRKFNLSLPDNQKLGAGK
jgi:tetratricopeptide (TPR) repeat protein